LIKCITDTHFLFVAVDSKRKPSKESDINIKELKIIWELHRAIDGEHVRTASYLLRYKNTTSSFIACPLTPPLMIDLAQDPSSSLFVEEASPDLSTSIADLMAKKRKVPKLFAKPTPEGTKKNTEEVPTEGTKKEDVALSGGVATTAKEVGKKPPVT